jgi:hypothetical protein
MAQFAQRRAREKIWKLAVGGAKKAVLATAHAQLRVVYRVLSTGQPHSDLPAVACDEAQQKERFSKGRGEGERPRRSRRGG